MRLGFLAGFLLEFGTDAARGAEKFLSLTYSFG